jgi:hypothetical protein
MHFNAIIPCLEEMPCSSRQFHSVLALYLNIGLFKSLDVDQAAESYYHLGYALINSIEGSFHQMIGRTCLSAYNLNSILNRVFPCFSSSIDYHIDSDSTNDL